MSDSTRAEQTKHGAVAVVTAEDRAFFRRLGDLERELPKSPNSSPPRTLAQVADELDAIERAWPWGKPLPDNSEEDLAHHRAVRDALLRLSRAQA